MSIVWDYFKKTLRLPFILAGGPLAMLAEGGAVCLDEVRDVIISLRDQFTPTRCETVYLIRFAAARGIVQSPLEPDTHWLARVRFAYHWWSRGGRASAMSEALRIGFAVDVATIVNLRSENPLRWASFRVVIETHGGDVLTRIDQVKWAINEVKPARSLLDRLWIILPSTAPLYIGAVVTTGQVVTIYPQTPVEVIAGTEFVAGCCQAVETVMLYESESP